MKKGIFFSFSLETTPLNITKSVKSVKVVLSGCREDGRSILERSSVSSHLCSCVRETPSGPLVNTRKHHIDTLSSTRRPRVDTVWSVITMDIVFWVDLSPRSLLGIEDVLSEVFLLSGLESGRSRRRYKVNFSQ